MSIAGGILTGKEAISGERSFDFIAPHPYSCNIELGPDGKLQPVLSVMSRMVLDASVSAWEAHPEATLVLAGETCYPGLPDTTDMMIERAQEISDIPTESIVGLHTRPDGQGYNNTYLQTEGLADFFNLQDKDSNVLSVSLDYHIERIIMSADAFGMNAKFVTAENVLHELGNHEYDQYLPHISGLDKSERVLKAINRFDPKGRLFNLMMRASGPRMVDVEGEPDNLHLVQTYAKKKLEALNLS